MRGLRGLNNLYANSLSVRELLESMQAGTLEPEVAFLNASLVTSIQSYFFTSISVFRFRFLLFPRVHQPCSWYYLKQIPDVFPVLAAAHKTLVSMSRESLTTRTLHSELVYNYSGSKHVKLLANQQSPFAFSPPFFFNVFQ